jgi:hypothetical protein
MSGEYTEILCGKNRHGIAPFEMPVKWNYSSMRFEEYTPGTDDNDPFFDSQIDGVELRTPEVKEEEPPEDYVPEDLF